MVSVNPILQDVFTAWGWKNDVRVMANRVGDRIRKNLMHHFGNQMITPIVLADMARVVNADLDKARNELHIDMECTVLKPVADHIQLDFVVGI